MYPDSARGACTRKPERDRMSHTSERSCAGAACHPRDHKRYMSTGLAERIFKLAVRLGRRISCLEEARFVVVMQDKSFSIHDVISGRKDWSL